VFAVKSRRHKDERCKSLTKRDLQRQKSLPVFIFPHIKNILPQVRPTDIIDRNPIKGLHLREDLVINH
jgi:hypothetical protein